MIRKKKKKVAINNRRNVRITVIIFILVHMAFWASGYLPDGNKYHCSQFRSPQSLSEYKTVSLIRWDYCTTDRKMEIAFDIQDVQYSEGKTEYDVIYDGKKQLESTIVYSKDNMIIIQIEHVPAARGKRISVRFDYTSDEGKDSTTSFYSYTGIINEVEALPVLSEKEYYINRQDYDIAYYEKLIQNMQNSIQKNEAKVSNIEKEIERLQGDTSNLTTDEILNLKETIDNDQSSKEMMQTQNEEYCKKIASYQETIKVLQKRKDAYE